jgi:hypothetical protein
MNATTDRADTDLSYGRAVEVWRDSVERYLDLARRGASAAALRAAANAVHQAALDKGRLLRDGDAADESGDTEH